MESGIRLNQNLNSSKLAGWAAKGVPRLDQSNAAGIKNSAVPGRIRKERIKPGLVEDAIAAVSFAIMVGKEDLTQGLILSRNAASPYRALHRAAGS